jgi:hypothetical protein
MWMGGYVKETAGWRDSPAEGRTETAQVQNIAAEYGNSITNIPNRLVRHNLHTSNGLEIMLILDGATRRRHDAVGRW